MEPWPRKSAARPSEALVLAYFHAGVTNCARPEKIGQKPEVRGGAEEDRSRIPAGFDEGVDLPVADDVIAIISRSLKIPVEQLTPDKRLDELGAESLDVIEILFELEEKFDIGITVRANELAPSKGKDGSTSDAHFATIGDLTAEVERLVAAKAAQ